MSRSKAAIKLTSLPQTVTWRNLASNPEVLVTTFFLAVDVLFTYHTHVPLFSYTHPSSFMLCLPSEIIHIILLRLIDLGTRAAAAYFRLICSRLNALARPLVLSSLRLDSRPKREHFISRLSVDRNLGLAVRKLDLRGRRVDGRGHAAIIYACPQLVELIVELCSAVPLEDLQAVMKAMSCVRPRRATFIVGNAAMERVQRHDLLSSVLSQWTLLDHLTIQHSFFSNPSPPFDMSPIRAYTLRVIEPSLSYRITHFASLILNPHVHTLELAVTKDEELELSQALVGKSYPFERGSPLGQLAERVRVVFVRDGGDWGSFRDL